MQSCFRPQHEGTEREQSTAPLILDLGTEWIRVAPERLSPRNSTGAHRKGG
jgi:hypothetical protein